MSDDIRRAYLQVCQQAADAILQGHFLPGGDTLTFDSDLEKLKP
jgi:hypothetical protein